MNETRILHAEPGFCPVSFRGSTRTYFPGWLWRTILSLATLGLYSPWAFLWRRNYFLGHTHIAGNSFFFHASAVMLLKARLAAVAISIAFLIFNELAPFGGLWVSSALFFCMGPLVTGAFRFIASNTSYQQHRFSYAGTDGHAWKAFALGPLLSILSLGVLTPIATRWHAICIIGNIRLGGLEFGAAPALSKLYKAWGTSFVLFAVLFALSVLGMRHMLSRFPDVVFSEATMIFLMLPLLAAAYFIFNIASVLYGVWASNIIWSSIEFGPGHKVRRRLPIGGYLWLVATNKLAGLFSLGLLVPWTAIRYQRYVARHTEFSFATEETVLQSPDVSEAGSVFVAEYMRLSLYLPSV